jgi:CheY-like chemotaxis protein
VTLKILVADDSATMRKIFEMTFAGEDARVIAVDGGDAAIAKAREVQPDVVLADGSLAGTDGYEVARALKGSDGPDAPAVILLASQHAPYDAERGKAAGVDDHVLKPFDTQSLIDKVTAAAGKPRAAAQAGAAPAASPAAPPAKPPAPPAPPAAPAAARPAPAAPAARPAPAAPSAQPSAAARPAAAAPSGPQVGKSTMSYGAPPAARPAAASPAAPAKPAAPPGAAPKAPAAAPARRQTMDMAPPAKSPPSGGDLAGRLQGMGLTKEQVEGVLALTHEVIEQVVWEVVPDLAETLIKEEIKRLTEE